MRSAPAPLHARLLGDAFDRLPAEIRALHAVTETALFEGRARVERGRSPLSRMAAALAGFPEACPDTPLTLRIDVAGGEEIWTRTFGGRRLSSRQFAGGGRMEDLLCERFGPLTFAMAPKVEEGSLKLLLRRWSVLGVPLPLWLAPGANARESAIEGRFRFHIEVSHPLTGLIVRYQGWLAPVAGRTAASAWDRDRDPRAATLAPPPPRCET